MKSCGFRKRFGDEERAKLESADTEPQQRNNTGVLLDDRLAKRVSRTPTDPNCLVHPQGVTEVCTWNLMCTFFTSFENLTDFSFSILKVILVTCSCSAHQLCYPTP